jgi:GntR family transcriptional repressor for pyruvate dehydrogenase complex
VGSWHEERLTDGATVTTWQPIKEPGSLTDRIVDRILTLVGDEQVGPGDRLPAERDMARMLGVSRPALREAVKVLEARGILVVRHGQGVFVARTPESEVRERLATLELTLNELFDMRLVLEEPAAAWAAQRATDDDVAVLAEALAAEEAARTPPIAFERLRDLDASFHMRIVQLARNRFLHQTLGVLNDMLTSGMETTLLIPGRVERARRDHRRIFDAIARRDADAAVAAVRAHITGARDAALARVRAEGAAGSDGGGGPQGRPLTGRTAAGSEPAASRRRRSARG